MKIKSFLFLSLGVSFIMFGCASNMAMKNDLEACKKARTLCENKLTQLEADINTSNRNLRAYEQEKSQCEKELMKSKERVSELEKGLEGQQSARDLAERRMKAYRDIAEKLYAVFDPGDLKIIIRNGRMVVQLPNKILFDFGKSDLKPGGKEVLGKVAGVLKTVPNRNFLILGHTCNIPVKEKNKRYKTNRELSTQRALSVVYFLEKQGVSPKQLGAAGYGEHFPEADNSTEEGRAQNRRTEIVIMPTIDEIPKLTDKI